MARWLKPERRAAAVQRRTDRDQRVRSVALGAYAHQNLLFEKLVEVLQPDRDLTRTPVFQIWFALQNAPRLEFNLPGLELHLLDVHNGTSKFDLGLFTVEKPDGLHCMDMHECALFVAYDDVRQAVSVQVPSHHLRADA